VKEGGEVESLDMSRFTGLLGIKTVEEKRARDALNKPKDQKQ
jgi:hypothetical protein